MLLLLDTHVLVGLVEGDRLFGRRAKQMADLALTREGVGVASISFWEIAMLVSKKRIALEMTVDRWRLDVLGLGIQEVPLTVICTLPPGISRWLKLDLLHRAERKFGLRVIHVVADAPAQARP